MFYDPKFVLDGKAMPIFDMGKEIVKSKETIKRQARRLKGKTYKISSSKFCLSFSPKNKKNAMKMKDYLDNKWIYYTSNIYYTRDTIEFTVEL